MADETPKATKYGVKNVSNGPRGINTPEGNVMLERGQVKNLDLTDAEKAMADKTGWFEFGDTGEEGFDHDDDGVVDSVDRDELKAHATELGIDFPKNIPTDKLNELVAAKLAEAK